MGYRVEYTTENTAGDPDTTDAPPWTAIDVALANDDTNDPYTVIGKTEFTWIPLTGDPGDENREPILSAGAVRWFRVIAITYENDGDVDTGGTAVNIETGQDSETSASSEDSPGDTGDALPVRGVTDGLGGAPADEDPEDPDRPMDLTAEAASDSNDLADEDRGIFLTWNAVMRTDDTTASETEYYVIERKRSNTGVDQLNDDDWVEIDRVYDATSYTDDDRLREDTETRQYRVGSVATGIDDPSYSMPMDMGVEYALHPDMHKPSAPQMVTAAADSATAVTVNWMTPADNGGSDITGFTVRVEGNRRDGIHGG